jgi:hypothetical protein
LGVLLGEIVKPPKANRDDVRNLSGGSFIDASVDSFTIPFLSVSFSASKSGQPLFDYLGISVSTNDQKTRPSAL